MWCPAKPTLWPNKSGQNTEKFLPMWKKKFVPSIDLQSIKAWNKSSALIPHGVYKLRPAKLFFNNEKSNIFTKNSLIWWNVTHPETTTLRKMSDPRTVVWELLWPSDKKFGDPCRKAVAPTFFWSRATWGVRYYCPTPVTAYYFFQGKLN